MVKVHDYVEEEVGIPSAFVLLPGLDPSGYKQSVERREEEEEKALLGTRMSEEERYKDCERFHFPCPQCGRDIIFDNLSSELVSLFISFIISIMFLEY